MSRWSASYVGMCTVSVGLAIAGWLGYGGVRYWYREYVQREALRQAERHQRIEKVTIELPAVPVWPLSYQQFSNLTEV